MLKKSTTFILSAFVVMGALFSNQLKATSFTNSANIIINDADASNNPVPASLYPSPITVSGMSGVITSVSVTIHGLTHAVSSEVAFILQAPNGRSIMLQSSVGLNAPTNDVTNYTYTISDAGTALFPDATLFLNGGTYKPTAYMAEEFTAPAPPNPAPAIPGTTYDIPGPIFGSATLASVFNNGAPNGQWKLFVEDFSNGDAGVINSGWSLNITTNVALAVSELNFNVVNHHDAAMVNWKANDISLSEYQLERKTSATEFEKIATLKAKGQTGLNEYQYADKLTTTGEFGYRLRMIDQDGKITYSETRWTKFEKNDGQIKVYPNPLAGNSYVELNSLNNESCHIKMINMFGQIMYSTSFDLVAGINVCPLNISRIPVGVYIIQISSEHLDKQLIIERNSQ